MGIEINQEVKEAMKKQRLEQLERKFFELQMDKISLEAAGSVDAANEIKKRLDAVQKAYEAVKNIK